MPAGEEQSQGSYDRFLLMLGATLLTGGLAAQSLKKKEDAEAWLFRDDIGAPHGIKGYEEQVNSVGMHHGHCHWPSEVNFDTYNSAT